MIGVAVKVTRVPSQTVVALAAILTLAVRIGLTVIVTGLEVAGLPDAHSSLEVISAVIISPSTNVMEV